MNCLDEGLFNPKKTGIFPLGALRGAKASISRWTTSKPQAKNNAENFPYEIMVDDIAHSNNKEKETCIGSWDQVKRSFLSVRLAANDLQSKKVSTRCYSQSSVDTYISMDNRKDIFPVLSDKESERLPGEAYYSGLGYIDPNPAPRSPSKRENYASKREFNSVLMQKISTEQQIKDILIRSERLNSERELLMGRVEVLCKAKHKRRGHSHSSVF
mmetsp:Transcript_1340/g.2073  ORF Transcript_1340/g.2073 Transcript_1340/m.2073 type:complete len:214 (+) Transcript_1340:48-689(+)